MYSPEAQKQESEELKKIRRSVDELDRRMAADGFGHDSPVPVLETSSDGGESSYSGERPTIDFDSLGRTESGEIGKRISRMERRRMREEGAPVPKMEVPVGRKQGEDSAAERVASRPNPYFEEKQKHRWFSFGRKSRDTSTSSPTPPQPGSYFQSNEGRRMIPDIPNYDHSAHFRHGENKDGRTENSERPQADKVYRAYQPEGVFRNSSKDTTPKEQPRRTSVLRDSSGDAALKGQLVLVRDRSSVPSESTRIRTSALDRARSSASSEPLDSDSVLRNLRETNPASENYKPPFITFITSEESSSSDTPPADESKVVEHDESVEPATAAPVETIDESSEASPESADSATVEDGGSEDVDPDFFDKLGDLSIPEPEDMLSEKATTETKPEPPVTPAPTLVPRMRMNIHQDRPRASALNKSAAKRSFKPENAVYNPYTNSFTDAQWRPLEDTDADSPQTV
jgi:hypothetical protein